MLFFVAFCLLSFAFSPLLVGVKRMNFAGRCEGEKLWEQELLWDLSPVEDKNINLAYSGGFETSKVHFYLS